MRLLKNVVIALVCLALTLGTVVPKASAASGAEGITLAGSAPVSLEQVTQDRLDYLKGLEQAKVPVQTEKTDPSALLDGIPVPPEVRVSPAFLAGTVDVIVTLPVSPSLAAYAVQRGKTVTTMSAVEAAPAVAAIRVEQEGFISRLSSSGVSLQNMQRLSVLTNAVTGSVSKADFSRLVSLAGSKNVHIARIYTVEDTGSNQVIGVSPGVRDEDPSLNGTGMYVGVVDTGVDYKHPEFGGSPSSTFPTVKIPAGYDFGDGDTDPMDTNDHGTHVSGIIAANGTLKGVAPEAKVVIAKIVAGGTGSASSATIMHAFDYMADPSNLDAGPEGTHPPVNSINMSFGSPGGWADALDPEQASIQACIGQGIVVALSAGNSANNYATPGYSPFYPDFSTVGSPSVAPGAISVASSENMYQPGVALTEVTSGAKYVYAEGSTSPNMVTALGDNGGLGYGYVDCGIGDTPDFVGKVLTGKIALISRGTLSFGIKISNAAAAGAVGAVIYNNTTGTISMNTTGATLPSCSITRADGLALKAITDPSRAIKFLGDIRLDNPNALVDTISSYSSWGPPPDFSFKPDLTAPGGNIWSTLPTANGSYANFSGTSMAAPHVAAAAALILEAHPDWTPAKVKTALMNTSKLLTNPLSTPANLYYSPHVQGAGRINVSDALHTDVVLTTDSGEAYVNLGAVPNYATVPLSFSLRLTNTGDSNATYNISKACQTIRYSISERLASGVVVTTYPSGSVTVPAHGTASVLVVMDLSSVVLPAYSFPYFEGFVTFTPTSGATVALHIPYVSYLGSWNDFDQDSWAYNPLIDPPADETDWSYSQYLVGSGLTWLFTNDGGGSLYWAGSDVDGNLGRNNIGWNPTDSTQKYVFAGLYALRDAGNLKIDVLDSTGAVVKSLENYNGLWKGNYATYGLDYSFYTGNPDTGTPWRWDGKLAGDVAAPEGTYYIRYTVTPFPMFNSPVADPPQVITLPLVLDETAPQATINGFVPGAAPHTWDVHFTGSDNPGGSGVWGYQVYWNSAARVLNGDPYYSSSWLSPDTTSFTVPEGSMVSISVVDNAGNSAWATGSFPALQFTTPSGNLPDGVVDVAYSTTLHATGGTGLYGWSLTSGALPDGLTLDGTTGTISGTPTVAGVFSVQIAVVDGTVGIAKPFSITIYDGGLVVSTSSLADGYIGVPYVQDLLAMGGNGATYSWTLNSGALPPGLTLNLTGPLMTTARITGTPTTAGTYPFTVRVQSGSQVALKDLSITVLDAATVAFGPGLVSGTIFTGGTTFDIPLLLSGDLTHAAYLDLYWTTDGWVTYHKLATVAVSPLASTMSYHWTVPTDINSGTVYFSASVWRNDGSNAGAGSYAFCYSPVLGITNGQVVATVAAPTVGQVISSTGVPFTMNLAGPVSSWLDPINGNIVEVWFSHDGYVTFDKIANVTSGLVAGTSAWVGSIAVYVAAHPFASSDQCHIAIAVYQGGVGVGGWVVSYSPAFSVHLAP